MEKINFIYCQLERIEWWERLKLIHLPLPPRFNFTPQFPVPLPPFPGVLQGDMGELLPDILYSSDFFLDPAWVFAKGCSSFQKPVQVCCREIPSMTWSPSGVNYREISGGVSSPPLTLSSPSLLFLTPFISFFALWSSVAFSPFLNMFSMRCQHFCCSELSFALWLVAWLVGTVWNHLYWAWVSPSHSSPSGAPHRPRSTGIFASVSLIWSRHFRQFHQ